MPPQIGRRAYRCRPPERPNTNHERILDLLERRFDLKELGYTDPEAMFSTVHRYMLRILLRSRSKCWVAVIYPYSCDDMLEASWERLGIALLEFKEPVSYKRMTGAVRAMGIARRRRCPTTKPIARSQLEGLDDSSDTTWCEKATESEKFCERAFIKGMVNEWDFLNRA